MTFQRAEIWDDIQSSVGTRLAVVGSLLRCEGREDLAGGDTIELDFPLADQAVQYLRVRRVVRLVHSDTFTEWRIGTIRGVNGEAGGRVTVTATTPMLDMADAGTMTETLSSGAVDYEIGFSQVTVEEVLDDLILTKLAEFGQPYWAKGVIQPTQLLNPVFTAQTPLGALRLLCDLARDPITNRPAELRIRRNGTTGYYIDILTAVGAFLTDGVTPQPIADLRYLKNLRATDHTEDGTGQATIVTALGDPLPDGTPTGVARAAFRLGTPTGLTYPITDPEGGPSPILEDAQFSDYYVVPDGNNPLIEITSSAVGPPATVTLASSTNITPGNVYELRRNFLGTMITELLSPVNFALYGRKSAEVRRPGFTGVRNLVPKPWYRDWTTPTSAPDGWEVDLGGTFADFMTKNTDALYADFSPNSVKMSQSADGGPVFGLKSGVIYPQAITDAQFFAVKVRVMFTAFSGSAWFYLQVRPGGGGDLISGLTLVSPQNLLEQGTSPALGVAVDVIIQDIDLGAWNAGGVRVHVRAGAGGGFGATMPGVVTCYVSGVALYQQTGPAVPAYYEYSGANAIWAAGIRALAANAAPPARWELDVDDLTRFDGTASPFDELVTGATINLTNAALGANAIPLRIVAKPLIDYQREKVTRIAVANRAQLLAEYLNSTAISSQPSTLSGTIPAITAPPPGAIGQAPSRWEGRAQGGSVALVQNIPAALTEIDAKYRRHVVLGEKHNVTVHVKVGGNSTAKLVPVVWDGAAWDYLNGTDGPYAAIDTTTVAAAVNNTVLGVLATTATDYRGVQLCSWATVGGDAAADPELGSFSLIGATVATSAVPPVTLIPTGGLFADWNPTEGSGEVVTDKNSAPGVRDLILGDSIANSTRNPTSWTTSPPSLVTAGFGGGGTDHHYLRYNSAPDVSAGSSIFFYGKVTTLGTATKYLCGFDDGVVIDHHIGVTYPGRLPFAMVTEDSGGGGTNRTATGATVIADGSEHTYCLTHDGVSLKLYIDGVLEATTACLTALEPGGRVVVFCCGQPPLTGFGGPDAYTHGRGLLYTRALSATEVATRHAQFALTYTGLPLTTPTTVEVFPGESIQAAVTANPDGTSFLLKTGTHIQQSVIPKTGNSFYGEAGTVLDGEDTTQFAFKGWNGSAWVNNVSLIGFTITRYASPAQNGAIWGGDDRTTSTSGWVLNILEVSYSENIGVRIGNGMQVLNCNLHHNGTLNIGGVGANVLVEDTEIAFANPSLVDPGFEAGGTKFVKCSGLIVRGCYIHDNAGPGLWTDINNINTLFEDNRVEDNAREGIVNEVSYSIVIRRNEVHRNGLADIWGFRSYLWNAGIAIHASPDAEIYDNNLSGNLNGICAIQQERGAAFGDVPEEFGPFIVENLNAHDNVVTQNVALGGSYLNLASGAACDFGDDAIFTSRNNHWEDNTYNLLTAASQFAWLNSVRSSAEWVAYGHDDTGTFNY